jgi:6-pyruvoyltetrahydropterin/6-carboxytetrahydropterin synthase
MEQYRVRIAGDGLTFSAAHFILLEGGECEPLHGHTYHVAAEVSGPLGPQHYVVDFAAAAAALRAILAELDQGVLLPTESPAIRVLAGPEEVEVRHAQRRCVFPRRDCRLLPLAATTAELLARHVAGRLRAVLRLPGGGGGAATVRVEVQESPGCTASCELNTED